MKKLIICFDFDGVCAFYKEWAGFDNFGPSIRSTAALTQHLKRAGHSCILWTTRLYTPKLADWLVENGFRFDSINSVSHNPSHTSSKPIADIYVDDRAVYFNQELPEASCDEILDLVAEQEKE